MIFPALKFCKIYLNRIECERTNISVEKYLKVTKKDWYHTKKIKLRSINI